MESIGHLTPSMVKIIEAGALPIFGTSDLDEATACCVACAEHGIVEFLNRGEGAPALFASLRKRLSQECPDLLVGVGTVLDSADARLYIAMGADFIVSPVFDNEVLDYCVRKSIPYIPGGSTPSEILTAWKSGVELVKVFPAPHPVQIKAIRGPFPEIRMLPTGGISSSKRDITAYYQAGAAGVGLGSTIFRSEWISQKQFNLITDELSRVRECIAEFLSSMNG